MGGQGAVVQLHDEMQKFVQLFYESSAAYDLRQHGAHLLDVGKVTDGHLLLAATKYVAVCTLLNESPGSVCETHAPQPFYFLARLP
jgi:hypothetical protein